MEAIVKNENLDKMQIAGVNIPSLSAKSLERFDEEKQQAILKVAESIDVLETEKIMEYGSAPLLMSFEASGRLLKTVEGTTVDQEVIKQVIELSKQANSSQDEFNLVLHEPSIIQKIMLKLSSSARGKREKEIKVRAVTCYKLLEQLRASCESWIDMLQEGYGQISLAAHDDKDNCELLEQYIVAGYIAKERIASQVEESRLLSESSGLYQDKQKYEDMKEGLQIFDTVLLNLEKSRAAFWISIGQLVLQEKTNKNIQIAVRTQKANSMALAAQQLRNAILDAQNREALEGQKSITKLNDELVKKVATSSALTAEESEKVLLNGVYTVEAALQAAKTVMSGCDAIKRAREERQANISAEINKLKSLLDELSPYVGQLNGEESDDKKSSQGLTF
ncbi:MAG: toxic anion resistance protein [Clostridia bacterium]|nr:toxic anion resistance protein [Clostridia bacterium]